MTTSSDSKSLIDRATNALLDQRLFLLDPQQFDAFRLTLDNPPPPNAHLRALLKKRPYWER